MERQRRFASVNATLSVSHSVRYGDVCSLLHAHLLFFCVIVTYLLTLALSTLPPNTDSPLLHRLAVPHSCKALFVVVGAEYGSGPFLPQLLGSPSFSQGTYVFWNQMDMQRQARLVKSTHGHTGMALLHEAYRSGSMKRSETLSRS